MIRRALLLALLLLLPSAARAQIAHSPFILQHAVEPEDFVYLATSPTFGPGGTIFDLSKRVAAPTYIGPPSANPADYEFENTTFKDASCASDPSQAIAFRTAFQNAADSTFFWLPQSCHMQLFVPAAGDGVAVSIANSKDDIQLYCADPDVCSIEIRHFPINEGYPLAGGGGVDPNHRSNRVTDGTAGDGQFAIGVAPQRKAFGVGTSVPAPITGQTCDWDTAFRDAYVFGSRVVKLSGADCQLSHTGGTPWGPGDIVRVKTDRITGYGSRGFTWLNRITCIRSYGTGDSDTDGTLSNVNGQSSLCEGLTSDNMVRFVDPIPWDMRPDAYYWGKPGEGLGENFRKRTDDTTGASVYAATSGHVVEQLERAGSGRCGLVGTGVCGVGATTENIAENIWFNGVAWASFPQYVGGQMVDFINAFGGGFYRGGPLNDSGRVAAVNFGGAGKQAGSVSLHSMDWWGTAGNAKCYGEITEFNVATGGTTTFKVAAMGPVDCFFTATDPEDSQDGTNWSEPEVGFSDDVADPRLAGKRFLVSKGAFTPCLDVFPADGTCDAGSIGTWTMTITGLNGNDPDGTGVPIDTTPGGTASNIDRYGGASFYWNPYSSGIRVVNSFFHEPMQHAINQGCTGCVYSANHVQSNPAESIRGRGPFNHGTGGSCGNVWELSSSDQPIILLDTSNRAPQDHGEGCSNTYFKLRFFDSGTVTWPLGSAVGSDYGGGTTGSGGMFHLDNGGTNQWGAANDSFSLILNSGKLASHNGTDWDKSDNYDGDGGVAPDPAAPNEPYQFYRMANIRNRVATGSDLDAWMDPLNDSTIEDVTGNENGESSTVPSAWGPSGTNEIGLEPGSLYLPPDAEFICPGSVVFEMGAYYDTIGGANGKLPAQLRYEGIPCPLVN